ncbi:hypothetical protein ABTG47_20580, partial [Acinetobacter baumannii]
LQQSRCAPLLPPPHRLAGADAPQDGLKERTQHRHSGQPDGGNRSYDQRHLQGGYPRAVLIAILCPAQPDVFRRWHWASI